jgi:uncharacterized RDD family membrane protein YckC
MPRFRVLSIGQATKMKSRFELGHHTTDPATASVIGSEALDPERVDPELVDTGYIGSEQGESEVYDARQQPFAASREKSPGPPRFVVEEQISCVDLLVGDLLIDDPQKYRDSQRNIPVEGRRATNRSIVPKTLESLSSEESSWRQQVTERLSNYQARRRPRGPRYPSLQLKFEEQAWPSPSKEASLSSASQINSGSVAIRITAPDAPSPETAPLPVSPAKLIAFPRSSTAPPSRVEELAEPVFDRPRILEGPEVPPPPAALGGILIEPTEAPADEKRPGFEMPLQSATMPRRLAATMIDGLIVLVGLTAFSYIFWRITAMIPPTRLAAGIGVVMGGMLWAAYQYLLIVYCGTSPGLKIAKLRLSHFDGTSVPRKTRRWRVLASVLSGLSLGLGYAWCFLDEDQLCWHDRITRTYMAPSA